MKFDYKINLLMGMILFILGVITAILKMYPEAIISLLIGMFNINAYEFKKLGAKLK